MRIEKDQSKHSLGFSGFEYPAISEEMNEPYDLSQVQTENMEIAVRVADETGPHSLGMDRYDFDLDYFQLSEE